MNCRTANHYQTCRGTSPSGRKWAFSVILHGAFLLKIRILIASLYATFHHEISKHFTKAVNHICFVFLNSKVQKLGISKKTVLELGIQFRSPESQSIGHQTYRNDMIYQIHLKPLKNICQICLLRSQSISLLWKVIVIGYLSIIFSKAICKKKA